MGHRRIDLILELGYFGHLQAFQSRFAPGYFFTKLVFNFGLFREFLSTKAF